MTDLLNFFSCGCCGSDLSVSFGVISLIRDRLSLFPRGKRCCNIGLCRRQFHISNIFRWSKIEFLIFKDFVLLNGEVTCLTAH